MAKNSSAKASSKKSAIKKPNKFIKFFKDLKSELKKVVWPSKKQVLNNTWVVLVVMTVVGLFIAGIDSGLGFVVKQLLRIGA